MNYLDKAQVTEATFSPDASVFKTAEGFIFKFLNKLIERDHETTIPLICDYLVECQSKVTFPKLCMAILLLHNVTVKNSEKYFAHLCREFSKLADSYYRLLFEVFYHNSQDLTDTER